MERFRDMRQFDEAKDNIIAKLSTLTDEQKKQVIEFFRTHNDFENRIDWNRAKSKNNPLTWKDFEDLMNEVENRRLPKEGIKDLTEGEDYVKLQSPVEFVDAYAILTHRGSVAIASNNTEPKVWTPLPKWYQTDNAVDDYPWIRETTSMVGQSGVLQCITQTTTSRTTLGAEESWSTTFGDTRTSSQSSTGTWVTA